MKPLLRTMDLMKFHILTYCNSSNNIVLCREREGSGKWGIEQNIVVPFMSGSIVTQEREIQLVIVT